VTDGQHTLDGEAIARSGSDGRAGQYLADRLPISLDLIDSILDGLDPGEMYEYAEGVLALRLALDAIRQQFVDTARTSPPSELVDAGHHIVDEFNPLLADTASVAGVSEMRSHLALLNFKAVELEGSLATIAQYCFRPITSEPHLRALTDSARQHALARQCQRIDQTLRRVESVLASSRGDGEARGSSFRRQLSQQRRQVQTLLDGLNKADADRVAELEIKINRASQRFEDCLSKVEKLLGEVAVSGVAHGHAASEARERTFANRWRLAAVGFAMSALITIGLTSWLLEGLTSVQWLTLHVGLILGLGGLAAYAGRQSAEHRREERWARDSRLRLAAVTIWLEDLPDEVRKSLKSELVEPFFLATPYERKDVSRDATSPMLNSEVMALIAKLFATELKGEAAKPQRNEAARDADVKP
jgi:hypothetical protein